MTGVRGLALGFAIVATACVVACGFSGEGSFDDPDAGSGPGRSGPDPADGSQAVDGRAPPDESVPTPVPICDPPSCALPTPPAGWELALLESARTDACPPGFDAADAIESPNAGTNACSCAACVTTGTNCSTGGISSAYDNGGGACGSSGAQLRPTPVSAVTSARRSVRTRASMLPRPSSARAPRRRPE